MKASAPWEFADAERRSVAVDGVPISYRLWDDAPPGAPGLLFLHGFRAHSHWWDHIVPFFRGSYRVATMDFSGLGDSGWRDRYTMHGFAREVLAIIAEADLAPATIIAHSFGGSPAAFASVVDPGAIRRAIIIDSRMVMAGVPAPDARQLQWIGAGSSRIYADIDEVRRRYRLVPSCGGIDSVIHDHIARYSARLGADGWSWKFDPSLDPQLTDDEQRLEPTDVIMPIDFFYGEHSAVITPGLAQIIASLLPNCRPPIAIPACDHHILLEQPIALVSVLRTLLRPQESP